ncbi:MAG: Crp/Fnr family transcriptional regulator, partial [Mariprofundaceae bacterium]
VKKGSFLVMEGDFSEQGAYLLLAGDVEVYVGDMDGGETLLFTLGAGQLVGELSLLGIGQRTAFVRCLTNVRALRISRTVWDQAMKNEAFLRKVLNAMTKRFEATQNVVRRLGQSQAAQRFGVYLLGREEWAASSGDEISIEMPTHVNLARMLNCTREHVTKVIKRFNQAGIIVANSDGRKVTISRSKISEVLSGSSD